MPANAFCSKSAQNVPPPPTAVHGFFGINLWAADGGQKNSRISLQGGSALKKNIGFLSFFTSFAAKRNQTPIQFVTLAIFFPFLLLLKVQMIIQLRLN